MYKRTYLWSKGWGNSFLRHFLLWLGLLRRLFVTRRGNLLSNVFLLHLLSRIFIILAPKLSFLKTRRRGMYIKVLLIEG